ncbi:MAG: hypothetical protein ACM3NT_11940 [Methylocystaceae bacterium]
MPIAHKRPHTGNFGRRPALVPTAATASRYRHGQLITNNSFEAAVPWQGWQRNKGVDLVFSPEYNVHSGLAAASLGELNPEAQLSQIINGVIPGRYYQLSFFLLSLYNGENAPIKVSLHFLDISQYPIGKPALEVTIGASCLCASTYTGYLEFTRQPAPTNARYAKLLIEMDAANYGQGAVLLDDLTLIAIK